MKTGRLLEKELIEKGFNALWIANRGMIIMPNTYGTDCCVSGKYRLLSKKVCADIIAGTESAEHADYAAYIANRSVYEVR